MLKLTLFIITFFLSVASCFGQDTIRVETSTYYTSDKEPKRGKHFASRVKYAREDIVFSDTHKRIDYCYYYDNKRQCYGTTYQITSDTTLDIDGAVWHYKNQGDKYFLERYFNGTYECGSAKLLIPLETVGLFTTTTADKIDILWTTDYAADKPSQPYDKPLWTFHKTKIKGKIYAKDKIDEQPTFMNGDTLKTIFLNRKDGCISEPYYYVSALKFVITKEGRIVNIEQSIGNIDLDYCPSYVMDLIRYLLQSGQIKPAKVKGQNVNVQWTLKVEMDDKSGSLLQE
jgi:hypothetical protein